MSFKNRSHGCFGEYIRNLILRGYFFQCNETHLYLLLDVVLSKMAMQVGHRQDGNASATQARWQWEWDTDKMSMQVGHILDGNVNGTQAR